MRRADLLFVALIACTRSTERITPAPEPSIAPAPSPPPPPALVLDKVRCQYGGTAPAFFVWVEATATREIRDVQAKTFEVATKGAFVNGASSTIDVRKRDGANGEGNVKSIAVIDPGATHLEVFGPLAMTPFGAGASYPTEDRKFRVELETSAGRFVLEGTCVVGPAG
jgi:hypothetical protein